MYILKYSEAQRAPRYYIHFMELMNTYTKIYLAELWRRARLYLADFFWNATFYLDEVFRHATFYLAELFRHATFYLAEQFRHATFYLAEMFRQIAFPKSLKENQLKLHVTVVGDLKVSE